MNIITCEKKENGVAEIVVGASPEEFESALNKAFLKKRNQISVPGFRRGKAPRRIIERMLGASTFHADALEIIMPDVAKFVEDESGLRIVGKPRVEDVDIKEDNSGVEFTIDVSVYPEVELGDYKGLQVEKPDAKVPESEVDAEIAGVRIRNAAMEKVDRPAVEGDTVLIDFKGFMDGAPFEGGQDENYELELGSNSFIPGFEEKLVGITAGEKREIDLVFPEDYEEEMAGKPVVFEVTAHEIREKLLPELDDEFAKDVSEFDTFKEYKADIREKLEKTKQDDSDAAYESALMDKVIESMETTVPEVMIDEQHETMMRSFLSRLSAYGIQPEQYLQMMNMTPEMFGDSMRVKSERQVRINLALEKIAELEGIEVSAEDIEQDYKEASERYGMEINKLKENVKDSDVVFEIKTRRAIELVKESAISGDPEAGDEEAPAEKKTAAKPKKPTAKKPAAVKQEDEE